MTGEYNIIIPNNKVKQTIMEQYSTQKTCNNIRLTNIVWHYEIYRIKMINTFIELIGLLLLVKSIFNTHSDVVNFIVASFISIKNN